MKRHIFTLICALLSTVVLQAQNNGNAADQENNKKEIIKKGFNFGPLPVVADRKSVV